MRDIIPTQPKTKCIVDYQDRLHVVRMLFLEFVSTATMVVVLHFNAVLSRDGLVHTALQRVAKKLVWVGFVILVFGVRYRQHSPRRHRHNRSASQSAFMKCSCISRSRGSVDVRSGTGKEKGRGKKIWS